MDGIKVHLARVRKGVGNSYPVGAIVPAPLGMAISPSHWQGFPWGHIGRYADAVLPMGYWSYRTDCPENPDHCAYGYSAGNIERARDRTGLPVHEIGGVANRVTSDQVVDFVRATRDAKALGGSLYDYRTTAGAFWSSLRNLNLL